MVICLAALLAMNGGRKRLVALQLAEQPLPALARLIIAKKVAATMFWDMLADFVSLKLCPADWLPAVHSQHPFVGIHIAPSGQRSLVLHRYC